MPTQGAQALSARDGDGALAILAYVFGTFSCTMTSTQEPVYVSGVWGLYHSAMVPDLWGRAGRTEY